MKQRSQRTQFPSESETVKWKQLFGKWEEIVATCAAFATAQGRTIHVGINPNGEVVGIDIGKGTLEDIINRMEALEMGYNPNDCVEIRWGTPEGSEEYDSCQRRAPKDQRSKMIKYRTWFQRRIIPVQ